MKLSILKVDYKYELKKYRQWNKCADIRYVNYIYKNGRIGGGDY